LGDFIESIREVDLISQRSINEHQEITFFNNYIYISTINQPVIIFDYIQNTEILFVIDEPEILDIPKEEQEKINNPTILINPLEKLIITY
jgi:hypothetical protein